MKHAPQLTIAFALLVTVAGCPRSFVDTDGGPGTDAGGSTDAGGGTDSGPMIWNVPTPDPGYLDIFDTEPNDTPDTADNGGTITASGYWGTSFTGSETLGGTDVVDYVSFATGGLTTDTVSLPIFPCWTPAIDLIDWFIYEVTPGAPLTLFMSSITTDLACEGAFDIMLPGGTLWLLEMRTPTPSIPAPMNTEYFW